MQRSWVRTPYSAPNLLNMRKSSSGRTPLSKGVNVWLATTKVSSPHRTIINVTEVRSLVSAPNQLIQICQRWTDLVDSNIYFAYGSNLNVAQMLHRCPKAEKLEIGVLDDWVLSFKGEKPNVGWCNISPLVGASVTGGLWRITADCLLSLDSYEEYPTLYDRSVTSVRTSTGVVNAWTYWMLSNYKDATPTELYLRRVKQGFRDFGIDTRLLDLAIPKRKFY
jgi:hypothetical protein